MILEPENRPEYLLISFQSYEALVILRSLVRDVLDCAGHSAQHRKDGTHNRKHGDRIKRHISCCYGGLIEVI